MRIINGLRHLILGLLALVSTDSFAKTPNKTIPPVEVVTSAHRLYFHNIDIAPAHRPKPKRHQTAKWLKSGVLRRVYLSTQKSPDWVIDVNREPSSWLCGTGGCPLHIYRKGDKGNYIKVFDARLREWSIKEEKSSSPYLLADFHGSNCGLSGVNACPFAFEWQEGSGFIESARFTKTVIVRAGALPQAIDALDPRANHVLPEELSELITEMSSRCIKHKGTLDIKGLVSRTPDLNDDGHRDWMAQFNFATCSYEDASEAVQLAASERDDCEFLVCETVIYLSTKTSNGVQWVSNFKLSNLDFGFEIRPKAPLGQQFAPVQIEPKPGHGPDSDAPCTYYEIKNCIIKPLEKASL